MYKQQRRVLSSQPASKATQTSGIIAFHNNRDATPGAERVFIELVGDAKPSALIN
jgi:hypothetical protein